MVDNFDKIYDLLQWNSEDEFYFVQIIKRKKENPEVGSNSHIVKFYYVTSIDYLEKNKGEMIALSDYHNARLCINLNKRSFEKTAFHTLRKVTDQIMNKDFKNVRKAYNSVCGTYSSDEDRIWIVDIDEKGRLSNDILRCIDKIEPIGNKLISILETKNGIHLITKPFNVKEFRKYYPDIDIHKNNPTILYMP